MAPAQPPPTPAHIHAAVVAAFPAVSPRVLKTPLERHLGLSHWANALLRQAWERSHATAGKSVDHIRELWTDLSVWIKWESEQRTGAFKIRGATNKILHEVERARREGRPFPRFVTSSTGNHGEDSSSVVSPRPKRR
ncbi:hypothetical protein M427DRAFT_434680 [Gonapodya prolifera JEL478]|uniref:Tryptophan synthase beta chain-like PALP domain-containing protein n=1 Tax=Gonapodya prolifera (strain JEL478) TaxID=1344416 RepID=A0A139ATC3_GONPJ|nr:hypothetical protein M427DRAFT_434680 [Gonapodya prolifera JEL478]|eukprot:KXS19978.1 hypothetical protein M427DRAFT_434680 [Gonapodya prolifera JEL478]